MATHQSATNLVKQRNVARMGSIDQPLNRRRALRMLSALAAAAAGAAALNVARPERASAYVQTEPSTQFTGPIASTGSNGTVPDGATVIGTNTNGLGVGVYGNGGGFGGYGLYGSANIGVYGTGGNYGVYGINDSTGWGVYGINTSSGTGAYGGSTNGVGVQGQSVSGTGVLGQSISGSNNASIGVYGQARGSSSGFGVIGNNMSGGVGVYGQTSGPNPAIQGFNPGPGPGLQGYNTGGGIGLQGTATGSAPALQGYNTGAGPGVVGQSVSGLAGLFAGPVTVTGVLTVMGAKSAAVRGADGGLKRLYSLESPESWFEDFGSDRLSGGSATVQLEPGFAGVVHGDNYRVFLTPQDDSNGLYVSGKKPNGFTVREQQGGKSNIAFDYRIVAKRKDIPGARLEHVDESPALPPPPTPPSPPPAVEVPAMPSSGSKR